MRTLDPFTALAVAWVIAVAIAATVYSLRDVLAERRNQRHARHPSKGRK